MEANISDFSAIIVDDSIEFSSILKKILLKKYDFQNVQVFNDIASAEAYLPRINAEIPLVFFVDYNFPNGRKGTEFISLLKDLKDYENLVTFLVTSDPTLSTVETALQMGVSGVLAKPIKSDQLGVELEKACKKVTSSDNSFF
jgi:DNA-binding NtrC family response regulator